MAQASIHDVIVHTNHNTFAFPSSQILKANPPSPDPFPLGNDLWIGKIDAAAARIVLDLGEPNYYGIPKPVIQYAQLYSFVRDKDRLAAPYQWDEDARLQACVAVSRPIVTRIPLLSFNLWGADGGTAPIFLRTRL